MDNIKSTSGDLKLNGWQIQTGCITEKWIATLQPFVQDRMNSLQKRFEEWAGVEIKSPQDYQDQQKKFKRYEDNDIPKDCRNFLMGMLDVPSRLDSRFIEMFKEDGFSEKIQDILQSKEFYCYYPPMIRFTIPGSTTSMVPVHQDAIFATNFKNFYTLWFALVDITKETPGMNLYNKSHLDGPLPHVEKGAWGFEADVDLSKYEKFPLRLKAGDLFMFDPYFLHESATNPGPNVRFSMDLRMVTTKDDISSSYWDGQKKEVVRLD